MRASAARQAGFTLIEVLVALGIVAVALLAGLQASNALTRNAQRQADMGLAHKRSVQMNSIELFKALCLDLRGPKVRRIGVENVDAAPFAAELA